MATDTDRAKNQARGRMESIRDMVGRLLHAKECHRGECTESGADYDTVEYHDEEAASSAIHEDALSVEIRSGWTVLGEPLEPAEYLILLSWGGPAVRIVGELDMDNEPDSARLECQDWFIPWTEYVLDSYGYDVLLTYVREFYFDA
jgi:hypothetical protein